MRYVNYWGDVACVKLPGISGGTGTVSRVNTANTGLYGFNVASADENGAQAQTLIHEWARNAPSTRLVMACNVYMAKATAVRNGNLLIVGYTTSGGKWVELGRAGAPKTGTQTVSVEFTMPAEYASIQAVFNGPKAAGENNSFTRLLLMTVDEWTSFTADPPAKRIYSRDMPIIFGGGLASA